MKTSRQEDCSWLSCHEPCGPASGCRHLLPANGSNREIGISRRQQFGVLPIEHDELCEEIEGSYLLRPHSRSVLLNFRNTKTPGAFLDRRMVGPEGIFRRDAKNKKNLPLAGLMADAGGLQVASCHLPCGPSFARPKSLPAILSNLTEDLTSSRPL